MKRKSKSSKPTTSPFSLRKETLRRLVDSELQRVAGGARAYKPVGFADDTTPIYSEVEEP